MTSAILQLEAISKTYPGGTQALRDVDLAVNNGEILCLLGPSGCGKTTLLRVVAGLEAADAGSVRFQGRDLAATPPHQRGFGFMFQDFALFPHRTVAENVEFGLRMAKLPRAKRDARVAAMLDLVNLPGYGKRTIFELSGGERQRVALARSLAPEPALLMLDEPLGSLDRGLREELVEELRTILKEMGVTALYVTHDQDEAMALSDRIVVMQHGRIEQIGTPREVYTNPATPFVARFFGYSNLLPAHPTSSGVTTPLGLFPLHAPTTSNEMTLLLRPEAARLIASEQTADPSHATKLGFQPWANSHEVVLLHARLRATTYHGSHYRIEVDARANASVAEIPLLRFQLPTYQRQGQDDPLQPIQLPPIGAPIALLLSTNLTTLLPYPVTSE